MGAIRRNLPVISGKGMICFRNVFLRLLLSLFICTCFAEAHAERAEPLPKAFKDAQTLFEKGRWRDAEGAFRQVEEAGILRYRSRYMVALCKEKQKLFKQAEADYARLIRDDAAFRQAPIVYPTVISICTEFYVIARTVHRNGRFFFRIVPGAFPDIRLWGECTQGRRWNG